MYSSLLKQLANCIPRSKSSAKCTISKSSPCSTEKRSLCEVHKTVFHVLIIIKKKKTTREVRKQQLNSPFLQKTLREMDQNILTKIKAHSAGEPRRNKLIYFLPSLATFIKNFILGENLSRIICSKLQLLRAFIE